tara:strand:- start:138 stop:1130 length:993 start_codon:yes stop_codon:yes gene_type:complete
MSQIEVNKIIPQSGTSTQLGESGDTITIPAGATITNNGTANGFGSADTEKVKVSANDTTAGFLNGKLVAGTNISLTEGTDGGNETLTAALTGTIATAQIADDAVTLAKMAPGTDGNIISYDASGNPVAVATGSVGQVLTSAGAGAPPTFANAGGDVVLLASSGNLTSGSRYNADNVFSSTYKSYKIIGTNLRFSADAPIAFVFRTGGGSGSDSTQSRYSYVNNRVERDTSNTASALTVTDWNGSVGKISQDIESGDNNKTGSFEFQVFDPYATKSTNWTNHTIQWDGSGSWIVNIMGGGTYNYEAALTGIGIYPSSGNYVNGEIKIYGFK